MIQRRTLILPAAPMLLAALLGSRAGAQLDLPKRPQPAPRDPAVELLPGPGPRGDLAPRVGVNPLDLPGLAAQPGAAPTIPITGAPEEAARVVFRSLAKKRDLALVGPALEQLLALGPTALGVARGELGGNHGPSLIAAARLCLLAGQAPDRAAVAARLQLPLPPEATQLLEELLVRDPVLASPEYLAGLLDHPGAPMRSAAQRALEARLASVPLAALGAQLGSKRTATRSAALELVARSTDPLAWNLVASLFGDPSAQIARRAGEILAAIDGAEPLLIERSFPGEEQTGPLAWDRARAYALLALVEREELRGQRLLEGEAFSGRVESLRSGLTSAQPLVAGATAVALARMGFRASAASVGSWLDREVPHQLVRCVSGAEFHADFSSLERPALRALGLLTGMGFGADADAWRRWWLANAGSFRARHAVIELSPDAHERLEVRFRDGLDRNWRLLGSARPPTPGTGTILRLDGPTAERLLARLEVEGVFGVERLPEARVGGESDLCVLLGSEEKRFRASGPDQPWLDALRADLAELVDENRWQLYVDPLLAQESAAWRLEQERWAAMEPVARQRELVSVLLTRARLADGVARDECIAEIARLYADAAVPVAAHFEPLLGLLALEATFGPRAESLCELARVAAGAGGEERAEPGARERLVSLVLEHFGPESDPALQRVARNLEAPSLRVLLAHPLPRARALAIPGAMHLPEASEIARTCLGDPEPEVRMALLVSLTEATTTELAQGLHAELLERARNAPAPERVAALGVLARLGGAEIHDLALEALGDEDPSLQRAGVAALAELADPRSASLLASILARGPASPLFSEARRGLARLGAVGVEECLRLARSVNARARREATLLLSERLVPEAAALLLTQLTEDPRDERLVWELSVLSGLDLANEEHPERAAWSWWDLVVHDDSLPWLLAAAERAGLATPARASLAGELTPEGARFLLDVAAQPAAHLGERGARELELRLGLEFARPSTAAEFAQFQRDLREAVQARLGE